MSVDVDILVPTCDRPASLAVTLGTLIGQTAPSFRVVVSDQGDHDVVRASREVRAVVEVLRNVGREVEVHRHLPRRGLAEQRQFLLDAARAPYVLFLDDDVILEPDVVVRLVRALRAAGCGFVGAFVNSASGVSSTAPIDEPPPDVDIELWDGPVLPDVVHPGAPAWDRHRVHFAAYLHRLASRRGITKERERLYKVAWVGGCVLFDTEKLRAAGGFGFWRQLPSVHCGEDVVAQLRVMARWGGAGLAPSGAWHQEVPTTSPDRRADAPFLVDLFARGHVNAR